MNVKGKKKSKENGAKLRCNINPPLWQWMLDNFHIYKSRLEAIMMQFYSRMIRISWRKNVSNEVVLKKMETKRRQLKFLKHMMRKVAWRI